MSVELSYPEAHDGRVALVRFDRSLNEPGDRANALSSALLSDLTDCAHSLERNTRLSAVVLTGAPSVFTLGADLKEAAERAAADTGLGERLELLKAGPRLCEAWERIEALTIAAVEGWCVGGGAALVAALDLRVMAENARLYIPEIERGMNMSWGSVPRLVSLIGPARTKRLVALCEKLDAPTAQAWGLADHVVPAGGAVDAALEIAARAAALPPLALRMAKADVNAAATALHKVSAHRDREAFALAQSSEDFAEGVRAFLEGRSPNFSGR